MFDINYFEIPVLDFVHYYIMMNDEEIFQNSMWTDDGNLRI